MLGILAEVVTPAQHMATAWGYVTTIFGYISAVCEQVLSTFPLNIGFAMMLLGLTIGAIVKIKRIFV